VKGRGEGGGVKDRRVKMHSVCLPFGTRARPERTREKCFPRNDLILKKHKFS
jgi:hypothetical protein